MKFLKAFFIAVFLTSFVLPSIASAALLSNDLRMKGAEQEAGFYSTSGFGDSNAATVPNTIATIIKTVLGLLGIIFVVLIIVAGFKWMMAGGNEKDVDDAKSRIKNSIIGLLIVLSAYAITAFVFNNLPNYNGSGDDTTTGTQGQGG